MNTPFAIVVITLEKEATGKENIYTASDILPSVVEDVIFILQSRK